MSIYLSDMCTQCRLASVFLVASEPSVVASKVHSFVGKNEIQNRTISLNADLGAFLPEARVGFRADLSWRNSSCTLSCTTTS